MVFVGNPTPLAHDNILPGCHTGKCERELYHFPNKNDWWAVAPHSTPLTLSWVDVVLDKILKECVAVSVEICPSTDLTCRVPGKTKHNPIKTATHSSYICPLIITIYSASHAKSQQYSRFCMTCTTLIKQVNSINFINGSYNLLRTLGGCYTKKCWPFEGSPIKLARENGEK